MLGVCHGAFTREQRSKPIRALPACVTSGSATDTSVPAALPIVRVVGAARKPTRRTTGPPDHDLQLTRNDIMQELNLTEMQQVNGGIIPLLIGLNVVIWLAVALK
jgi:lactobin A/cerein 7B family class IIb bacteriocin